MPTALLSRLTSWPMARLTSAASEGSSQASSQPSGVETSTPSPLSGSEQLAWKPSRPWARRAVSGLPAPSTTATRRSPRMPKGPTKARRSRSPPNDFTGNRHRSATRPTAPGPAALSAAWPAGSRGSAAGRAPHRSSAGSSCADANVLASRWRAISSFSGSRSGSGQSSSSSSWPRGEVIRSPAGHRRTTSRHPGTTKGPVSGPLLLITFSVRRGAAAARRPRAGAGPRPGWPASGATGSRSDGCARG